jgi:hypothetical protein
MRTNKLLIGALAVVAIVFASCSPASITTGAYTGTYSAYNWTSSSGNATANVTTVNDNTVNVKITASGTDFTFDNITVTKIEAPGAVVVQFSGSNSLANFDGTYASAGGVNSCSLDIDSSGSAYGYVHFSGSK